MWKNSIHSNKKAGYTYHAKFKPDLKEGHMNYSTIKYEIDQGILILRLNRPERMNAVNEEMYFEIAHLLQTYREDEGVRVVILTGSVRVKDGVEKQAFCAGADLKKHSAGERTHAQKRKYIEQAHETTRLLYRYPKPIIAAVNGPARGAGTEMALSCDFIIMSDEATIAFPETGLGTFVGGGVTLHLPRTVGLMKAKELVYTGRVLDAAMAVEMGIALYSYPMAAFTDHVLEFAAGIARKAPIPIAMAKKHLQRSAMLDLETVIQLETDAILACMDTEDWQEGINAFTQKRNPVYRGK
jgi:enoyl-CoA hydratase